MIVFASVIVLVVVVVVVVVVTVLCCMCAWRKDKMDISPQSRMHHICMCLRTTVGNSIGMCAYLQVIVIEDLLASLCRDGADMPIEYVHSIYRCQTVGFKCLLSRALGCCVDCTGI